MKITHVSNSFILVESADACLCCDPWVGSGNHGGWHSFPEFDRGKLLDLVQHADAVYISHLHSDHFDAEFLVESGLIELDFFIKRYENSTLASRLRRIGVSRLHEVEAYFPVSWRDMELTVIPQHSSTTANLRDDINYDLDTSLIVNHAGVTFFNQVDNPLSREAADQVSQFVTSRYGRLDVAALVVGAAGEYPQCFLNIDRNAEAFRIARSSLTTLGSRLETLCPEVFFPAGGTYFIPGKFSGLNRFIAQPSDAEIRGYIEEHMPHIRHIQLEGGRSLSLDRSENRIDFQSSTVLEPRLCSMQDSINEHLFDLYEHETEDVSADEEVDTLFQSARANWLAYVSAAGVTVRSRITFELYDDLRLDERNEIGTEPIFRFKLITANADTAGDLTIHIDRNAFVRCITRRASWNQTLSGSLCLFTREPNVHHPSDLFSLNRFVV